MQMEVLNDTFEPFYQTENSLTHRHGIVGVILAVGRDAVHVHRERIEVES